MNLIHLAHVRSNPLPLLGQLATWGRGADWLFSALALVAIYTQESCRLPLVGDHFAGAGDFGAEIQKGFNLGGRQSARRPYRK